jgi:predicted Zn-dependent peptidase
MDYQKTCLPNGIRIVTSRMPHVRSATVIVYVGVGSRYESDRLAGISHFLEHMLFKGTERRRIPC